MLASNIAPQQSEVVKVEEAKEEIKPNNVLQDLNPADDGSHYSQ